MTAAFDDATRGTDQRFTDALSGSDGTADPSILMPVLDVYPDALSAPMPIDLVPVIVPPTPLPPDAGIDPIFRNTQRPVVPTPVRPRQPQRAGQQTGRARAYVPANQRLTVPRTPVPPARPAAQPPSGPTLSWQGRQLSASDVAAAFRSGFGQQGQVDRTSFQATHPQSQGSASPAAVAPAAPMASQYTQRGQIRNTARDQAQERRRSSSNPSGMRKRASSSWAVIVLFLVIGFSTGLLQKIIDFVAELINQ
ncbi:MAG: hypothetical protein ABWZ02_07560 [Nakamurella sp.]